MRAVLILVSAVILGLGGGYAWFAMAPGSIAASKLPKAASIALPASPEEQPEALDQEWAARAEDRPAPAATGSRPAGPGVYYAGCDEVRAAGKAPLHAGQPGYREGMDGDGDGVACEPYRGN